MRSEFCYIVLNQSTGQFLVAFLITTGAAWWSPRSADAIRFTLAGAREFAAQTRLPLAAQKVF